MKFSNQKLEELKRSVPTWRILSDRGIVLTRKGAEYECCCPFHSEKTASFKCFQRDGLWLFKCFGCRATGNCLQLVEQLDKIPFDEAVEKVASIAGWGAGKEKVEQVFKPVIPREKQFLTFPLAHLADAELALTRTPAAIDWLAARGITLETAKRFHLGYIQSAAAINPHHEWVNDGWIITPIHDGETITLLKYRSLRGKKTPSGEPAILRKSGMATGLFNAQEIQPFDDVFVVEGEWDVLVLAQAGYTAVSLPSAGYTLTPEMRDKIMQANTIYLAGDMDNVGQQTMTKLWTELRDRTYLIKWPDGNKDANEVFQKVCKNSVGDFKILVEALKQKARATPMPFVYDLRESILSANTTNPMDNIGRLHFPWPKIDSWCAVLPGDVMCLLASETGMGKTSFVLNILIDNAIKRGKIVVNYSAELSPEQYARRVVAHLIHKDNKLLERDDYLRAAEMINGARFYNGYKPGANYKEVIELLKWAKRRIGADVLVIDHIHFLTRNEKDEIKAQSEAMRALKDLAVEYRVIIIVVGQPRKPQAVHRGREAVTQDIKGSEALGSDASQVFILHRNRLTEMTDAESTIFDPITKVKLDKSRESDTAMTKLYFDGKTCTFFPLTGQEEKSESH